MEEWNGDEVIGLVMPKRFAVVPYSHSLAAALLGNLAFDQTVRADLSSGLLMSGMADWFVRRVSDADSADRILQSKGIRPLRSTILRYPFRSLHPSNLQSSRGLLNSSFDSENTRRRREVGEAFASFESWRSVPVGGGMQRE